MMVVMMIVVLVAALQEEAEAHFGRKYNSGGAEGGLGGREAKHKQLENSIECCSSFEFAFRVLDIPVFSEFCVMSVTSSKRRS